MNKKISLIPLQRGKTEPVEVEMKRAFSTKGWIIADMHNHTTY